MYKLHKNLAGEIDVVVRIEDNACIPFDPDNTDYQAFKLALTQGAVLQDADGAEIGGKTFLGTLK